MFDCNLMWMPVPEPEEVERTAQPAVEAEPESEETPAWPALVREDVAVLAAPSQFVPAA